MAEQLLEELKTLERYRHLSPERLEQLATRATKLRQVGLFDSLSIAELAFIAESGRVVKYECGDLIIRKGDTDQTFYVIIRGQVRVWDIGPNGVARLLNYHAKGDFFGEMAPLNDTPRAANVDVVDDVELVAFDPDGFERIIQHQKINDYLRTWGQERILKSNRRFEGKHWDEISIVLAHKSWFALLRIVLFPGLMILMSWALSGLLIALADISRDIVVSLALAVTVGMGLWIFWMYEDWHNDDLIVTSKRIIHIERILVPPFPVERHEVYIDQVQDITTRNHGPWTYLFNVRTLEIKTAGVGIIEFPYLDRADGIRDEIFRARDLARVRRVGEERSRIRHTLLTELERPAKQVMPLVSGEKTSMTPEREGILKFLDYFVPRMRIVKPDQIIWRKHWLVLAREVGVPAVLLALSLAGTAVGLIRPGLLRQMPLHITATVPGVAVLIALGWYLWNYDGWRNDIYIVTDERIIDIEGSPFHLQRESRTEGTFDVIQNTDYSSPNWLFRVLRIGDVTIDTAAKQNAFTFDSVPRPEEVQQEIFKRLTAFREKRSREAAERQYAEFTKWFGTYHRSVMEQKEQ
jgi:CRP/FNR family cyclic AMP-dependent transcriptional regulator